MGKVYAHWSDQPVTIIRTVEQTGRFKPSGLWISSEGNGDGWSDWCKAESYRDLSKQVRHDVVIAHDANLLRIPTPFDLDCFTREFAKEEPGVLRAYEIDWPAVAKSWGGIIIEPYHWSRRLSDHCGWYYSWDCASGCIWDPACIAEIRHHNLEMAA